MAAINDCKQDPLKDSSFSQLTKREIMYWSNKLQITPSELFSMPERQLDKYIAAALQREVQTKLQDRLISSNNSLYFQRSSKMKCPKIMKVNIKERLKGGGTYPLIMDILWDAKESIEKYYGKLPYCIDANNKNVRFMQSNDNAPESTTTNSQTQPVMPTNLEPCTVPATEWPQHSMSHHATMENQLLSEHNKMKSYDSLNNIDVAEFFDPTACMAQTYVDAVPAVPVYKAAHYNHQSTHKVKSTTFEPSSTVQATEWDVQLPQHLMSHTTMKSYDPLSNINDIADAECMDPLECMNQIYADAVPAVAVQKRVHNANFSYPPTDKNNYSYLPTDEVKSKYTYPTQNYVQPFKAANEQPKLNGYPGIQKLRDFVADNGAHKKEPANYYDATTSTMNAHLDEMIGHHKNSVESSFNSVQSVKYDKRFNSASMPAHNDNISPLAQKSYFQAMPTPKPPVYYAASAYDDAPPPTGVNQNFYYEY